MSGNRFNAFTAGFSSPPDRGAAWNDDRSHQDIAAIAHPDDLAVAPDPGDGLAAAVDDFFRLGPNAADLPVFLGAFYPILLNTMFRRALRRPASVRGSLNCSAAPERQCSARSYFPLAYRRSSMALRIAHGFAWIPDRGWGNDRRPDRLGSVVMDGRTLSRTDLVITGMIVIGACGFVYRSIIVIISNRC